MKDTTGVAPQLKTTGGANIYSYKSFKQRIDAIKINISRRVEVHLEEEDDDEEFPSEFSKTISKWNELNCTKDYTEFMHRVRSYHQSFVQVVYHKNEIISVLEEYLTMDHEPSLEPILELVAALACDLRKEVLPNCERFVHKIMPLIQTRSPEIVEAASTALAYLFKYHSDSLVHDLRPTFGLIAPLLGSQRQRSSVRRIAAETLSFLVRKLKGSALQQFVAHTIHAMLECSPEQMDAFREGIALLYFEAMHSTKLHFYSSASGILTVLLRELYKEEVSGLSLEDNDVYSLVATVFKLCLHHASRTTAAETLWKVLFDQYDILGQSILDNQTDRIQPLLFVQGLLALGTVIRKGDRVSEYKPLFQRCRTSFELSQSQPCKDICGQDTNLLQMFAHERLRWLSGLLVQSQVTDLLSSGRMLLDMAFAQEPSIHLMSMALSLARLEWKQWNQIMLPYMVRMTVSKWEDTADRNRLLWFWTQIFQTTDLINTQQDKAAMSTMITSRGQIVFPSSDITNVATSLVEWLSEPTAYVGIGNTEMTIPDSRKQEFEGFDEDKEGMDGSVSVLATKSAILTMLAKVSVEPKSLYEGLCTFVQQITKAINTLTQKLCAESSYLEHISDSPDNRISMGPAEGETWGDEANELLGLYQDKNSRLYWGQFKQVHPLLNLLGQALGLLADTASHLGTSVGSAQVIDMWNQVVDEILPIHHVNHMLIEGLVKLADTLKFVTSTASIQGLLDTSLSVQRLEQLVPHVEDNLMSFQPQLRLQTLRLLALFQQPAQEEDTKTGKNQQPCDIIQQGIELESIPAKLDTYKEKTNPLRRMAVHAANDRIPKIYSNVFPYLAIAQFSVNFSLLWTEIGKQLALLADKDGELLWSAIWQLLRRFNDERLLIETGLTPEAKEWICTRQLNQESLSKLQPTPKLEGYLMNCPYLVQFDKIFDAMFVQEDRDSLEDVDMQALMIARDVNGHTDRIDYNNVYKQLIKLLAENGASATAIESHSEPIVKSFIGFIKHDLGWMVSLLDKKGEAKLGLDIDLEGFYNATHRGLLVSRSRRVADTLTTQWLTLFSKFRNQRSLYLPDHLYTLFMRLLSRGDASIQRKALDCILARKDSAISPYADNLRNLVDDKRFRDELKTFNLAVDGEGSINAVHRDKCLPIVFRLLHGQMVARHGKSSRKEGMRVKRMAIFNAMVGITPDELRSFVFVGLDSFDDVIAAATPIEDTGDFSLVVSQDSQMDVDNGSSSSSDSGETKGAIDAMERVSHKAQLSYFHLLTDMIRILGFKATPVFHESLVILLSSIGCAQRQIDMAGDELEELAAAGRVDDDMEEESDNDSDEEREEDDEEDDALVADDNHNDNSAKAIRYRRNIARNVRQMAVKCLVKMFELQSPQFDFAPYIPCIYEVAVDPRIDNLAYENSQNSSALLLLFRSWSLTPKYFSYLVSYNPLAFQMLLSLLVAPSAQPKVITLVLDILQTFLDYSSDQAMEQFMLTEDEVSDCTNLVNKTIQDHVSFILSHMCTCFGDNNLLQLASGGSKKQQHSDDSNSITQNDGEGKTDTKKASSQALRQIQILSRVADYADKQAQDAKVLLDLLLPVLKRPNRAVPEHSKNDILLIMLRFIPLVLGAKDVISDEDRQTLFNTYFEATSSAFGRIRLDSARMTLGRILAVMAESNSSTCLKNAATLIDDINSCANTVSGGPDFDRRLAAYARLNEEMWDKPYLIDAQAWVPILYNLKYYAQDHEELSIRSNSAFGIARFITLVAKTYQTLGADDPLTIALSRNLTTIILPAVKHAFTSVHESVRLEFVGIWRKAIRECGEYIPQLADLTKLDSHHEEANFFYNIGHIQLHRRQRALRRFRNLLVGETEENQSNQMEVDKDGEGDSDGSSSNDSDEDVEDDPAGTIKQDNDKQAIPKLNLNESTSERKPPAIPIAILRDYFIPLFEHWVLDETGTVHHELANEAVLTIGAMGAVLPWTQYCSALRKYLSMMQKSPALERRLTRLILALMDKFHFDLRRVQVDSQGRLISRATDDEDTDSMVDNGEQMKVLEAEQIHETIVHKLLPQLKAKISDNDDKTIALKAPVSMAVVRILTAMPTQTMNTQLPGILTTICNMLRSKAQPVRNATRKTLVRISNFLGPKYFGFLVSELSSSLSRGPQIHVLGYTIFVLIKEMMRQLQVGDLDYVVEPVVEILVKDTFGEAGDEKDDDEWVTKLKEAKVHHGPDCFEMLASVLSFEHVRLMLAPLRDILRETDTPKRTKKIENVLHRISAGLNRNRSYNTREILIFSQGIISQYLELSATTSEQTKEYLKAVERQKRLRATGEDEVTVHMTRDGARPKRDYLHANAHIFVHFGLEIVHHGLRRNRFDTNDVETLGLLDPFVGLTADGLGARYNSIIAQCCKIWTLLVRLPLPSMPAKISLIVERLFVLFRQSSNTNSEMIQSCFKLLASLLRSANADKLMEGYKLERIPEPEEKDGRSSLKSIRKPTKETKLEDNNKDDDNKCKLLSAAQLRDLIDFIRPDLEDPDHQATAFTLVRAILHRRLAVDTLYTLLDYIRELMITAQTPHMRETCRLTWFQFLMDYPMGERRLTNAMTFIIQNASGYVFESGRMSALEIMSVIIDRFADDVLMAKCAESFFLGLVLIIAKDESAKCREMAAHLLPQLVVRFDQPRLQRVWVLLDQWSAGIVASNKDSAKKETKGGDETETEAVEIAKKSQVKLAKMRELGRAALQCYGLLVEPLGERFFKHESEFISTIDSALTVSWQTWKQAERQLNFENADTGNTATLGELEAIAANLHQGGEDPEQAALLYWETAYTALNTYGKYVSAWPQKAMNDSNQSRIWLLAMHHLSHPHAWTKLAASRLIGLYVSNADPAWMLEAEKEEGEPIDDDFVVNRKATAKYVLLSQKRLQDLTHALLLQLNSRYLTADLGNQIVKNLYFVAKCFLTAAVPSSNVETNQEEEEGDEEEEEATTKNGSTSQQLPVERTLSWLINRVGRLARTEIIRGRGSTRRRTYCFRWFAAVIMLVPPELLQQSSYIMAIVSPLHRTTEDEQLPSRSITLPNGTKKTPEEQMGELKTLAKEVIKVAQDRIGVTAFSTVLNKIQKHVDVLRSQRREQRKQLAITNPQRHIQEKQRKHEASRRKRQEKSSELARKKIRTVVRRAQK